MVLGGWTVSYERETPAGMARRGHRRRLLNHKSCDLQEDTPCSLEVQVPPMHVLLGGLGTESVP